MLRERERAVKTVNRPPFRSDFLSNVVMAELPLFESNKPEFCDIKMDVN